MKRRQFITLLGGAAVTWPRMASAQQATGMPRVVHLAPIDIPWQTDGTRRLLSQFGYIDGRTIRLEFRNAAGNADTLPALAQELVLEGGIDIFSRSALLPR